MANENNVATRLNDLEREGFARSRFRCINSTDGGIERKAFKEWWMQKPEQGMLF